METMVSSEFSRTFFTHRPKEEVVSLCRAEKVIDLVVEFYPGTNPSEFDPHIRPISIQPSSVLPSSSFSFTSVLHASSYPRTYRYSRSINFPHHSGDDHSTFCSSMVNTDFTHRILWFEVQSSIVYSENVFSCSITTNTTIFLEWCDTSDENEAMSMVENLERFILVDSAVIPLPFTLPSHSICSGVNSIVFLCHWSFFTFASLGSCFLST